MILYITKLEKGNIGADMHYKALCDIFGRENIFFINLSPIKRERRLQNYISYGKYKTVLDRVHRWMQGNMMFISNDIISEICEVINSNAIKTVFIEDSVFGNLVKKIKKNKHKHNHTQPNSNSRMRKNRTGCYKCSY